MKKTEEKKIVKKEEAMKMAEEALEKVVGGEGAFDGFPRTGEKQIDEELTEGRA